MPAIKIASPAQIAANRRNARLSTGPKTEEGKARSRANAVKHGLAGVGVALPAEDRAAVEEFFLQIQEELTPTTRLGAELAHRIALLRVRQRRAERQGAARLRIIARHAAAHFDQGRADIADRLLDAIEAQPRPCRRQLLAMPEGIDRLIDALLELMGDLEGPIPAWSERHHKRLDALFGYKPGDLPVNRPTRFSRALLGDPAAIAADEAANLPEGMTPMAWAFIRTIDVIDAEVERLREHRATLDLDLIAEDRDDSEESAQLDAAQNGSLIQRYEAALGRELSRTLRDYHLAEALGAPDPGANAAPVSETPNHTPDPGPTPPTDPAPNSNPDHEIDPKLASSGESTAATSPPAAPAPVEAPIAADLATRPVPTVESTPPIAPNGR